MSGPGAVVERALGTWAVVGWPVLALAVVAQHRPSPRRRPAPVTVTGSTSLARVQASTLERTLVRVGTIVLRMTRSIAGRSSGTPQPPDPAVARRAAVALVVGLAALPLAPLVVPLVVLVAVAGPVIHERRRQQQRQVAAAIDLPDVLDLLRLALDAGCTVPQALTAVADHHRGALAGELRTVADDLALHGSVDDALEGLLRRVGEPVRPLCQSLLAGVRLGLPVAAVLDSLGTEARAVRRRRAEAVARRLPVALLFPLVACTLPAFALLTVVPLIAGGLRSVRW